MLTINPLNTQRINFSSNIQLSDEQRRRVWQNAHMVREYLKDQDQDSFVTQHMAARRKEYNYAAEHNYAIRRNNDEETSAKNLYQYIQNESMAYTTSERINEELKQQENLYDLQLTKKLKQLEDKKQEVKDLEQELQSMKENKKIEVPQRTVEAIMKHLHGLMQVYKNSQMGRIH